MVVVGVEGGRVAAGGEAALASAEVVLGARRHLAAVVVPDGVERVELGAVEPALHRLAGRRAVVLASGAARPVGVRAGAGAGPGCGPIHD